MLATVPMPTVLLLPFIAMVTLNGRMCVACGCGVLGLFRYVYVLCLTAVCLKASHHSGSHAGFRIKKPLIRAK